MIIKEMKQKKDGKLYYVMIAMVDGIKHKAEAQITDSQDAARALCISLLGIVE